MDFGSALGNIAGNLLSIPVQDYFNRKAENRAYERSKRAIQDTVADAKKAGIHPLYALGSAPSSSPTFSVGDAAGSAVRNTIDSLTDKVGPAQLDLLKKQGMATEAEMLKALSEAKRNNKEADLVDIQIAESITAREALKRTYNKDEALRAPWSIVQLKDVSPAEDVERQFGGALGELYGMTNAGYHSMDALIRAFQDKYVERKLQSTNPSKVYKGKIQR